MSKTTVIIPTYNRGLAVLSTLRRIAICDPTPADVLVHIDANDGELEIRLAKDFPRVRVLTSPVRLGPGGGRHKCLLACQTLYAVSFDDDSYPVDPDFFERVESIFDRNARIAVIGAKIWHRFEEPKTRTSTLIRVPTFTGCGHAVRLQAYRGVRGYLPCPVPYGMEETDLALQFFEVGWQICDAGDLRVFHDTELKHHNSSENNSGTISNVALFAFLHYPIIGWWWGVLQLLNAVSFSLRVGRFGGICSGLLRIPTECYNHRHYRRPLAWTTIRRFLHFRRTGTVTQGR